MSHHLDSEDYLAEAEEIERERVVGLPGAGAPTAADWAIYAEWRFANPAYQTRGMQEATA